MVPAFLDGVGEAPDHAFAPTTVVVPVTRKGIFFVELELSTFAGRGFDAHTDNIAATDGSGGVGLRALCILAHVFGMALC